MIEKSDTHEPNPAQVFGSNRSNEKLDILPIENTQDHKLSKAERIAAIDGAVANPAVSLETFQHLELKKILWKMDVRIVPVLTILYLLAFLDRGNIGNAKIEGLAEDLHLTGGQYNWALTAFFFTYCAFEVSDPAGYLSRWCLNRIIGPQQYDAEKTSTIHLAAKYHGRLGHCHDTHGHRTKLPGLACC